MRIFLIAVTCVVSAHLVAAAQPTSLRERARKEDVKVISLPAYAAASLDELVTAADTILVGTVQGGRPLLSADETGLYTDYGVVVERVIKSPSAHKLAAGLTVIVRRLGGVMTVSEGFNIVHEENHFPPFNVGERYILFLAAQPQENLYLPAHGPQGAFRISEGVARQVSPKYVDVNVPGPLREDQMIGEITRALKKGR